ncbi:MAG: STAS domain-containing protein [Actinomycetota bacterium]
MNSPTLVMDVRKVRDDVSVIDVKGDVTAASEDALTEAFEEASPKGIKRIVFNFEGLEYMNSSGIGLIVTLLVRANRAGQKIAAYGLTEHYRQIFELTRLDDAISIHSTESEALA